MRLLRVRSPRILDSFTFSCFAPATGQQGSVCSLNCLGMPKFSQLLSHCFCHLGMAVSQVCDTNAWIKCHRWDVKLEPFTAQTCRAWKTSGPYFHKQFFRYLPLHLLMRPNSQKSPFLSRSPSTSRHLRWKPSCPLLVPAPQIHQIWLIQKPRFSERDLTHLLVTLIILNSCPLKGSF